MPRETRQTALQPSCLDLARRHSAIEKGRLAGTTDRRAGCVSDPHGWFSVAGLPVVYLTLFTEHYLAAYRGVHVETDLL